jgi:biotin carboxyl carrier protein
MKMEISIHAPFDGEVDQVRHAVGDMVEEGTVLVEFVAPPAP